MHWGGGGGGGGFSITVSGVFSDVSAFDLQGIKFDDRDLFSR